MEKVNCGIAAAREAMTKTLDRRVTSVWQIGNVLRRLAGLSLAVSITHAAMAEDFIPGPWHLVDVYLALPDDLDAFNTFSVELTIKNDIPNGANLYISTTNETLAGRGFYNGLQMTKSGDTTPENTDIPRCRGMKGSRRAIFSEFDEVSADAMKSSPPNGTCEVVTYEGNAVSVRKPFAWTKGIYTIKLSKIEQTSAGELWVAMDVINNETLKSTRIGSLRFPNGAFGASLVYFVEIFGSSPNAADIPNISLVFGKLRYNEKPIQPIGGVVCYRRQVPSFATVESNSADSIGVIIDQPHDRSKLKLSRTKNFYTQLFEWDKDDSRECP